MKSNNRVVRVEQFPEAGNTVKRKTQVAHRQRVTVKVKLKSIYKLRRHT